MSLTSLLLFNIDKISTIKNYINFNIEAISTNRVQLDSLVETLLKLDTSRILYLGSSYLKSVTEESSLKYLELRSGNRSLHYNSPLGFRHGPKSFFNDSTLFVIFLSNNLYTRKY